jgi:competence protein ComEC
MEAGGGSVSAAVGVSSVLGGLAWLAYRFRPGGISEPPPVRDGRRLTRQVLVFAGGGAAALAIVPVSLSPRGGPGELEVAFLNVGQGDAILVTTPSGQQILVDGGPSGILVADELAAVMPHWDRSLDAVVLTHPQEDHAAGLVEVARRFSVGRYYTNGFDNPTVSHAAFKREGAPLVNLAEGETIELDGIRLDVLWPPRGFAPAGDLNNTSLVIRLEYGSTSFLLTGDSEAPALEEIMSSGAGSADVLKVPHHGSQTTPPSFFQAVSPSIAVISAGEANAYGHPHQATLDALAGTRLLRTDIDGRIVVRSDGHRLAVSTER